MSNRRHITVLTGRVAALGMLPVAAAVLCAGLSQAAPGDGHDQPGVSTQPGVNAPDENNQTMKPAAPTTTVAPQPHWVPQQQPTTEDDPQPEDDQPAPDVPWWQAGSATLPDPNSLIPTITIPTFDMPTLPPLPNFGAPGPDAGPDN